MLLGGNVGGYDPLKLQSLIVLARCLVLIQEFGEVQVEKTNDRSVQSSQGLDVLAMNRHWFFQPENATPTSRSSLLGIDD